MAYTTLSPSGLRWTPAGDITWNANDFTYNITRLNNTLLKLSALGDVNVSGILDGDVLSYNTSTAKWEPDTGPTTGRWLSTTTTSTSSSSTTSTTN